MNKPNRVSNQVIFIWAAALLLGLLALIMLLLLLSAVRGSASRQTATPLFILPGGGSGEATATRFAFPELWTATPRRSNTPPPTWTYEPGTTQPQLVLPTLKPTRSMTPWPTPSLVPTLEFSPTRPSPTVSPSHSPVPTLAVATLEPATAVPPPSVTPSPSTGG